MPGITMIGDSRNANRWRPTSLPAEARSTCRLLRLLGDPQVSSEALVDSLRSLTYAGVESLMSETIDEMGKHGWDFPVGVAENRMSVALDLAVRKVLVVKDDGCNNEQDDDDDYNKDGPSMTKQAKPNTAAVVSDSSGVSSADEEESLQNVVTENIMTTRPLQEIKKDFWASVLESLHLQVASRTTRVWGKKKIYEIYQLCSPAQDNVVDIQLLCRNVEKEFRAIFHGGTEDQSGCRVYALVKNGLLYIQINIGKPFDYQDERNRASSGEKKKKKPNEFVALVEPGSCLLALTNSRAPSSKTARFTKYVLTALEAALATRAVVRPDGQHFDASVVPKRFGDWTGTEPRDLLKQAQKAQTGVAVGRFAKLARDGSALSDPLVEFQKVNTESLVDRSLEQKRLKTGLQHGRHVAQLQKRVHALVAANEGGVLCDGAASVKLGRKRARDCELGAQGDCPVLQRVAWKWSGETTAAAACVLDNVKDDVAQDFPKIEFKCGVVMEGTNVFEGLRKLMAAGLTKPTLPDFVRDAPTLGSATITVDHGEFGGTEAFAAV